jgi:hypothetical protein
VGGLTTAINSFRSTLANNPLAAALRDQVNELEERLRAMTREAKEMRDKTIPAVMKAAKKEERAACDKKIEKVQADMEVVKRGLEQEQVQRRVYRKAAEEREQQLLKEIDSLRRLVNGD